MNDFSEFGMTKGNGCTNKKEILVEIRTEIPESKQ